MILWFGIAIVVRKVVDSLKRIVVRIAKAQKVQKHRLYDDSTKRREGEKLPRIFDKTCGKYFTVSSKVKVGKVGSPRWRAYCARSAKIKGGQGRCSKNQAQRRRWKC